MGARGPRPERTPENDIRLIANYCRRLEPILARLTADEIRALSVDDRQFLAFWTRHAGVDLLNAHDYAVEGWPVTPLSKP